MNYSTSKKVDVPGCGYLIVCTTHRLGVNSLNIDLHLLSEHKSMLEMNVTPAVASFSSILCFKWVVAQLRYWASFLGLDEVVGLHCFSIKLKIAVCLPPKSCSTSESELGNAVVCKLWSFSHDYTTGSLGLCVWSLYPPWALSYICCCPVSCRARVLTRKAGRVNTSICIRPVKSMESFLTPEE